jgi:hypothetical protein
LFVDIAQLAAQPDRSQTILERASPFELGIDFKLAVFAEITKTLPEDNEAESVVKISRSVELRLGCEPRAELGDNFKAQELFVSLGIALMVGAIAGVLSEVVTNTTAFDSETLTAFI